MPVAKQYNLTPGTVYRTEYLARYGKNPTRLAKRLVGEGQLRQLAHGLYVRPRQSKFGPVPPTDEALMRVFLKRKPFLLTGPDQWNPLGLGSTALFAEQLVYNNERTGEVQLGGRRFRLRRVRFPKQPRPEYFAVDLLKNHRMAGVSLDELHQGLQDAVQAGRLDGQGLRANAARYGTKSVERLVDEALAEVEA